MEKERAWAWDMSEMKAASGFNQQDPDTLQDDGVAWEPSISGFTPVNQRASDTTTSSYTSNSSEVTTADSKTKSSRSVKRRKIEQNKLVAPNQKPKRSTAAPRQAKISKASKGDKRRCRDISHALNVTKPGILPPKPSSGYGGQMESMLVSELRTSNGFSNASCPTSKGIDPLEHCDYAGLGQSYQAAFKGQCDSKSISDDPYAGIGSRCTMAGQSAGSTSDSGPSREKAFSDILSGYPASSGYDETPTALVEDGFRPAEPGRSVTENPVINSCAESRRSSPNLTDELDESNAFLFTAIEDTAFKKTNRAQAISSSPKPVVQVQNPCPAEFSLDVQAPLRPDAAQAPHVDSFTTFPSDEKTVSLIDEEDEIFINIDDFLSDDTFDEVLGSMNERVEKATPKPAIQILEDPFQDDSLDAEFMNLDPNTPERTHGQSPPFTQRTPTAPKLQWMPPTSYTPSKRSSPSSLSTSPISPTTPMPKPPPLAERSLNVAAHIVPTKDGRPVPFVRLSFPKPLLPRSPIMGVSQTVVLRTCFRIGEALNAASVALRNSTDAIVELYCRVKYSDRELTAYKQLFELVDLFTPDKGPSLDGQYAIWKGVDLWEYDSRQFLAQGGRGKKARVIGRIKRGKKNEGWVMGILSVWQVDWEDIGIAKGVVCS